MALEGYEAILVRWEGRIDNPDVYDLLLQRFLTPEMYRKIVAQRKRRVMIGKRLKSKG